MIYVALRDGGHGMETPGKRTPYIESLGRAIKENEFNEPVSALFGEELKRHGVIVHDISPTTKDIPLTARTDEANRLLNYYINKYGATNVRIVLVSFHFNAFDGSFSGANPSGISLHIQPGSTTSRQLAENIAKFLRRGTTQVYRGIIEQNLHITREYQGVSVLLENGFMDNREEALLMLDKDFQREVAREASQGVLEYFGLEYKGEVSVAEKDINKVSPWAKSNWEEATKNGYFDGTRPGANITREEIAIVVNRLRGNFIKLIKEVSADVSDIEDRLKNIEKEAE
jgi:N-acetylmuramoyl-L-alanine amidase